MFGFNDNQNAALRELFRGLGHLLTAASGCAYLATQIGPTLASLLLTVGILLIGFAFWHDRGVTQFVEELRTFRNLNLGAIVLAWATKGIVLTFGFWVLVFLVAMAFVLELAILADT